MAGDAVGGHIGEQDGLGGREDAVGVRGYTDGDLVVGGVGLKLVIGDFRREAGADGLDVNGVVIDFHRAAAAGAGASRQLVDGGCHGADFDDTLVDGVAEQSGSGLFADGGGEDFVVYTRSILSSCNHNC